MAGEIARWRANGLAERQHGYDIEGIRRRVETAEAEEMAIGQVTRSAMQETALTCLLWDQLEQVAPRGAPLYQMQAIVGASEMTEVIRSVRKRW